MKNLDKIEACETFIRLDTGYRAIDHDGDNGKVRASTERGAMQTNSENKVCCILYF